MHTNKGVAKVERQRKRREERGRVREPGQKAYSILLATAAGAGDQK